MIFEAQGGLWLLPYWRGWGLGGKRTYISVHVATWLNVELLTLQFTFFH